MEVLLPAIPLKDTSFLLVGETSYRITLACNLIASERLISDTLPHGLYRFTDLSHSPEPHSPTEP